jgi:DnaA family protein
MRQLILDLLPESRPSFDNFVTGSNAEALTGLAAWLAPGNRESLFFLWGEAGAGKSHLLQACPAAYHDARLDPELSALTPAHDCYAVDHLEALGASGQIVLFNLINRLRPAPGACSPRPTRRPCASPCARTCAPGWVVVWSIACSRSATPKNSRHSPNRPGRGLVLPPEVFSYLFSRAPRDLRSLAALLVAIDRYSLEQQRPITLPLLREVLQTSVTWN